MTTKKHAPTEPVEPSPEDVAAEAAKKAEAAAKLRDTVTTAVSKLRAAADLLEQGASGRISKADLSEEGNALVTDGAAAFDEAVALFPEDEPAEAAA